MPRARRTPPAEIPQTDDTQRNDTPVLTETEVTATEGGQHAENTPAPAEAEVTPAEGGQHTADSPAQPIVADPAPAEAEVTVAEDTQHTVDTPAPAEGEQPVVADPAPAEAVGRNQLLLTVRIKDGDPAEDIIATADVDLGNICTIRNVKVKSDDYGLKVVMPRTKLPDTGRFKDACYFHSREVREQFDSAVLRAYEQTQALNQESGQTESQEQGGMGGMTM